MNETKRARKLILTLLLIVPLTGLVGALPFFKIPAHPIDFSHRVHAGENEIDCEYCHHGARRSSRAVIPSVERCMGCHNVIATDKADIIKLKSYYDKGESIAWVRFFDLPDFTFFRHHPHIKKGFACQECHGEVQEKDRFREAPFLEMGWCLECHIENGASKECLTCHR